MMNMSYCRFENTTLALRECLGDVIEHVNEEAEYSVSEREIEWFRRMVTEFASFLNDAELLDEDGCLDEDALEDVCNAMGKAYGEEYNEGDGYDD